MVDKMDEDPAFNAYKKFKVLIGGIGATMISQSRDAQATVEDNLKCPTLKEAQRAARKIEKLGNRDIK